MQQNQGFALKIWVILTLESAKLNYELCGKLCCHSINVFCWIDFDDICHFPNQVKRTAKTPLCHISVSQWTLAAGAEVTSKEKKDRCAKVTGEVIYQTVSMLNRYVDGQYMPRKYPFEEENQSCLICHGLADMWHNKDGMNNQQGKMACIHCHQALYK